MDFIKKSTVIKTPSTRSTTNKSFDRPGGNKTSSRSYSSKSSKKNRAPPPAPMPPRLPTPDLSDLECTEFCECCGGDSSSKMDRQLTAAKLYLAQSRSRVVLGPEYERKRGQALRLEAGKEKKAC